MPGPPLKISDSVRSSGSNYDFLESAILPLLIRRGKSVFPVNSKQAFREGDVVRLALFTEQLAKAAEWLRVRGWEPVAEPIGERDEPGRQPGPRTAAADGAENCDSLTR